MIARHVNGESARQIAGHEGLARETVSRILSRQELVEMNARQYSLLQTMADKALDVLDGALSCEDPRVSVLVAMKITECVLPKGGIGCIGI